MRLFATLGFLLLAVLAVCQERPLEYRDVVRVECSESVDLLGTFEVSRDGYVVLPILGSVSVVGLSLQDAAARIRTLLDGSGMRLAGSLRVTRCASPRRPIEFTGSVALSGSLPAGKEWRLSDVVALAKPHEATDMQSIQIVDSLGKSQTVGYALETKGTERDVRLKPGDRVIFKPAVIPDLVSVLGSVASPGTVPFKEGMTVRDAIAAAGGMLRDANPEMVRLERKQVVVDTVNVGLSYDAKVQRGDVVRVPKQTVVPTVVVSGAVIRPGPVALGEQMTLTVALRGAGGISPAAKPDVVILVRRVDGKAVRSTHSLEKIRRGQAADPILEPGDVIEVPFRNAKGGLH